MVGDERRTRDPIVRMRTRAADDRLWGCSQLGHDVLRRLIDRYGREFVIVHGDATGGDESFGRTAKGLGLAVEPHPADWDRLGKGGGPKRNAEMVAAGAGLCIAVHRFVFNSKGTKDCARRAAEAGIPTYLIDSGNAVALGRRPAGGLPLGQRDGGDGHTVHAVLTRGRFDSLR
jgi:hypothetical protein